MKYPEKLIRVFTRLRNCNLVRSKTTSFEDLKNFRNIMNEISVRNDDPEYSKEDRSLFVTIHNMYNHAKDDVYKLFVEHFQPFILWTEGHAIAEFFGISSVVVINWDITNMRYNIVHRNRTQNIAVGNGSTTVSTTVSTNVTVKKEPVSRPKKNTFNVLPIELDDNDHENIAAQTGDTIQLPPEIVKMGNPVKPKTVVVSSIEDNEGFKVYKHKAFRSIGKNPKKSFEKPKYHTGILQRDRQLFRIGDGTYVYRSRDDDNNEEDHEIIETSETTTTGISYKDKLLSQRPQSSDTPKSWADMADEHDEQMKELDDEPRQSPVTFVEKPKKKLIISSTSPVSPKSSQEVKYPIPEMAITEKIPEVTEEDENDEIDEVEETEEVHDENE